MGFKKEHDWVGENLANPTFNNTDFKTVGVNASNTSIGPESAYVKVQSIRNNPEFLTNGHFDLSKFHAKYEQLVASYNKLASDTYEEDIAKNGRIFDYNNIFVSPEERMQAPQTYMTMELNPDHISKGIVGINKLGPRTMTPIERAEGLKIFDPATNSYTEDTPETSLFKNFFKPIVMATWDYNADINGNPTEDPEAIVYQKGEYKLNEDGEYYTEFLNGRSPYDKQIVSKWDILTPEGSKWNQFDVFDSDDIDKSTGGSIMRNALKIAPFFIPQVAPFYAAASLGINLTEALGTLGKLITGSENNTLNNLTAFTSTFNQSTSEYGQQHTFSLENIINMVGDTFTFLRSQRILAQQAPKFFVGKIPKNDEEFKTRAVEIANDWKKARDLELLAERERVLSYGTYDDMANLLVRANEADLQTAAASYAKNLLQNQITAYTNLGRLISTSTMAITFGLHTYGHAKAQGVSDTAATALTLGAIAGQYALLSSHIGQHIFPEAQILNQRLKTAIEKLTIPTADNETRTLGEIAKSMQKLDNAGNIVEKQAETMNLMQKGWNLAKEVWKVLSTPTRATIATTVALGVEMMSFTALDDVIASVYNLGSYIYGSDHRMSAWENMLERYGSSLIGGAIAGAIGANEIYKQASAIRAMNDQQAMLTILYMINEDKLDVLFKTIDKIEMGNPYLSGTKLYVVNDDLGVEHVYWDMGTPLDNLDLQNKKTFKYIISTIRDILVSNGAKVKKGSILDALIGGKKLLGDLRYDALLQSQIVGSYLQEFINNLYKLVKNGLILTKDPLIRKLLGITDLENREVEKEKNQVKKEEGDPTNKPTSPETKRLLQAEKTLKDALEVNQRFVSGDIAKDFIPDALFELIPGLNYLFVEEGIKKFLVTLKNEKTPYEDLSEELKEKAKEEYFLYLKNSGRKDDIHFYRLAFDELNKAAQPILKKGLKLSSEEAEQFIEIIKSRAPFGMALSASKTAGSLSPLETEASRRFANIVDIFEKLLIAEKKTETEEGKEVEKTHNPLADLRVKLSEEMKEYANYKDKLLSLFLDLITNNDLKTYFPENEAELSEEQKREQRALTLSLYDQEKLKDAPKLIKDALEARKKLIEQIEATPENAEDLNLTKDAVEDFLLKMLLPNSLLSFIDNLNRMYNANIAYRFMPKFFEHFYSLKDEIGYLDYDTRIDILNFVRSLSQYDFIGTSYLAKENDYETFNLITETLPNILGSSESEILKGFKSLDEFTDLYESETGEGDLNYFERNLKNLNEFLLGTGANGETKINVLTIDDWQIIGLLDKLLEQLDPTADFKISDLMSLTENLYRDLLSKDSFYKHPKMDYERFILNPDSVLKLRRVLQISEVLKSYVVAAADSIGSRVDMYGYNGTLNVLFDLKGDDKLVTIDSNESRQRMFAINRVKSRLETLLQISNLAQTLKFASIPKIDAKFLISAYDQLNKKIGDLTVLENHTFDDGTKFEGVQELKDAINKATYIQQLLSDLAEESLTDELRENIRNEFLNVAHVWHEFLGKKNLTILNDPKKLSFLINKDKFNNFGGDMTKYRPITEHEEPRDDMALMYLLSSFTAMDPDVFWSVLAKHYPKNRVPVEVQHILSYQQVAHVLDTNNVLDKFMNAYNESLKGTEFQDLSSDAKMIEYIKKVAGSNKFQKFSNIWFTEGSAGFGKSLGVTSLTLRVLSVLSEGTLKYARIYKPSGVDEIIEKADLSEELLKNLHLLTFEGKEAKNGKKGKLDLMKEIVKDYREPVINPETMEIDVKDSDKFEFDPTTNNLDFKEKIQTLPNGNKPKLLIFDEFTDISEQEWASINKFAKQNGLKVLAVGELYQSGVRGKTNNVYYKNHSVLDGAPWAFGLQRGNIGHSFSGSFSLRSDNILVDLDLPIIKLGRINYAAAIKDAKGYEMELHYYLDPNRGLFGTVSERGLIVDGNALVESKSLSKGALDVIKAMIADVIRSRELGIEKKIVYVHSAKYEREPSPTYKFLKEGKTENGTLYWDFITEQKGSTVKGEEAAYYIIDLDYTQFSDPDNIASEWYTALTRAKLGSLFIDRLSELYNRSFVVKTKRQKETNKIEISDEEKLKLTLKYLESINKRYQEVIKYTPSAGPAGGSESPTPGPTSGPDSGPGSGPGTGPSVDGGDDSTPPPPPPGSSGEIRGTEEASGETYRAEDSEAEHMVESGTPEETTDGTAAEDVRDAEDSNTGTVEEHVVVNDTNMSFSVELHETTFIDPVSGDKTLVRVNTTLNYGIYPFRVQRTGYTLSDTSTRDGMKADGYSPNADYRSDCVYGLRRIQKVKNEADIYDLAGKSETERVNTINKVINILESLRNVAFSAESKESLLQQFINITELNGHFDINDLYIREVVIKRNLGLTQEGFESLSLDVEKELCYGAGNLQDGNKDNSRANEVARTEYCLIFGLKKTKSNNKPTVLLTLPLAGLPNWETIIFNKGFNPMFRSKYREIANSLSGSPKGYIGPEYLKYIEEVLDPNSNFSYTDEVKELAQIIKKLLKVYLNLSNTVTFLPDFKTTLSARFKTTGPFIINTNRGNIQNPLYVEGFSLNTDGVYSSLPEEAEKPYWTFSDMYTVRISKGGTFNKYLDGGENGKPKELKQGSPYVFAAKGSIIPEDFTIGDNSYLAGDPWSDSAMIQYYLYSLTHPGAQRWIKKIAVDTPAVTIDLYLEAVQSIFRAGKEDKEKLKETLDIGNAFTAYRIIQKLYQASKDSRDSALFKIVGNSLGLLYQVKRNDFLYNKLDELALFEEDHENDPRKVELTYDLLKKTVGLELDGTMENLSLFTLFQKVLGALWDPEVVKFDGAEDAINTLISDIKEVTKSWSRNSDKPEEVIHYNLFFDKDSALTYRTENDYTVSFYRVENVDSDNRFKMHEKDVTFKGVLVDGPALGEIMWLHDYILDSFKIDVDSDERYKMKGAGYQKNSNHTAVYDKAHKEGGSLEGKTNMYALWKHERDSLFVYDKAEEEKITAIMEEVGFSEPLTREPNPIIGNKIEQLTADVALRKYGYFTYWQNEDSKLKKIFIVNLNSAKDSSGSTVEELQLYRLTGTVTSAAFKTNGSDRRAKILAQICDNEHPELEAESVATKISQIKSDHKGDGQTKPVILSFENKENPDDVVYVIGALNTDVGTLLFKFPSSRGTVIREPQRKSGAELAAIDKTHVYDPDRLYTREEVLAIMRTEKRTGGFLSDELILRTLERKMKFENQMREEDSTCTIILNLK